jgi:hypothetical protein
MNYKQLIPAIDWYFKYEDVVWNVAAFALTEDGRAIGLVGAGKDGYLKPVPTQHEGIYLHRQQLSDNEIVAADKTR